MGEHPGASPETTGMPSCASVIFLRFEYLPDLKETHRDVHQKDQEHRKGERIQQEDHDQAVEF